MCLIYSISKEEYESHTDQWRDHMDAGSRTNKDGFAALFIDEDTGGHSIIRSLNWEDINTMLAVKDDWTRVFVHQRAITRGGRSLENTHFWQSGDVFYCHNGVLRGDYQSNFKVDSLAIGAVLEEDGIWGTLGFLQQQMYANVFMIDMKEMTWYMTRSVTNTLFMDETGSNYSTRKLTGICDIPVPTNSIMKHELYSVSSSSVIDAIINDDDEGYNLAVRRSMGDV